ncbi:biotin transporter BioY [Nonomuraea sp. NN258]|uniref:biotin transporter BioY n=1 Tax=Nonomuraea antri TaxID=2730852 RepID=UPI00156A0661|nr:biotin transporter BioY [Nonomuraea antri]NRQ35495.1 biotin transporter BioY [Nonomuraea antri]
MSDEAKRPGGRRRFPTADLARVAVFAALIAVLGLVPGLTVFGPVPITLQTFGVMLAGLILGAWRAALSVSVLLVLVAAGLPLLAGGRGGAGVFTMPSAGYLIGWIAGAAVIGWLADRAGERPSLVRLLVAGVVGGIGVIYLFGVPVVALATDVPLGVAAVQSAVFLPGDLAKAVLAAFIARGVQRAYPDAVPAVHRQQLRAGGR